MEELLGRVDRPNARDYMSEALRCYQGGAFRACVVLSYIALFDDLRAKLAPLAIVNKEAKQIHQNIEKKAKDQEVYESSLSDQLAAAGLIDQAQKSRLEIIINLRNKAAHPSGVHASAEEARYVFFEAIDKFLSQRELQTTQAADAILAAIPQGNFFPTNQIADIRLIVQNEISGLHPQALPYLVSKLIESSDKTDPAIKGPAILFLLGLATLKQEHVRQELRRRVVIGKGQSTDYAEVIVSMLRLDPVLGDGLEQIERSRVIALLNSVAHSLAAGTPMTRLSNPVGWLATFAQEFGQDRTWSDYEPAVQEILAKYLYDPELMKTLVATGPVKDAYFSLLQERARSSSFQTANAAAQAIPIIDEILGAQVAPERAFRLLAGIAKAAEYGAWSARDLRDSDFRAATALRVNAAMFAVASPSLVADILLEFGLTEPADTLVKRLAP